jgi:hypothetical protein
LLVAITAFLVVHAQGSKLFTMRGFGLLVVVELTVQGSANGLGFPELIGGFTVPKRQAAGSACRYGELCAMSLRRFSEIT